MKNKPRKQSWMYLDLALKIQVPPKHGSKKLLLIFLAAKADDHGRSFHGYRSICAHLAFGSKSTVSEALKFLRDQLGVLTWEHGCGGFEKKDTNRYELSLAAMRRLIAEQGVFDPNTGRLKRYEVESTERTESGTLDGLSVGSIQGKVESTQGKVESTQGTSRVRSLYRNPQEPSDKINPQTQNPEPVSGFLRNDVPLPSPQSSESEIETPPSCAAPPVGSAECTRIDYGTNAVDKLIGDFSPKDNRRALKNPLELARAIRTALDKEVPDAPVLKTLEANWESRWAGVIGFGIQKEQASLEELRALARFAVDQRLPEIVEQGAPGLIVNFDRVRQKMKEAEVN